MKKTKREKKRLMAISIVIVALLISLVNSVAKDWVKVMENKSQIEELSAEYDNLLNDEEKLVSQVTRLQDEDYIARYAKEKYMYSGTGEIIIRMD